MIELNKQKNIGRVLFIVEGSKSEFVILRKIFCDILQYEYARHIFFVSGSGENEEAQRQEGEQSHIVGDQHRAYKGYVDQRNGCGAQISRHADYFSCQKGEETNVLQRTDHCKRTEKAGKRTEIGIVEIGFIGRYYYRGCYSK